MVPFREHLTKLWAIEQEIGFQISQGFHPDICAPGLYDRLVGQFYAATGVATVAHHQNIIFSSYRLP